MTRLSDIRALSDTVDDDRRSPVADTVARPVGRSAGLELPALHHRVISGSPLATS